MLAIGTKLVFTGIWQRFAMDQGHPLTGVECTLAQKGGIKTPDCNCVVHVPLSAYLPAMVAAGPEMGVEKDAAYWLARAEKEGILFGENVAIEADLAWDLVPVFILNNLGLWPKK